MDKITVRANPRGKNCLGGGMAQGGLMLAWCTCAPASLSNSRSWWSSKKTTAYPSPRDTSQGCQSS